MLEGRDPLKWRDILPGADWATDRALAQAGNLPPSLDALRATLPAETCLRSGDSALYELTVEDGEIVSYRLVRIDRAVTLRSEAKAFLRFSRWPASFWATWMEC